jgi:hypothetical protein
MRDYHLLIVTLIWVLFGLFSAWHFHDAHLFERFGALISGTAAIFVVIQVGYEGHLEEERKIIEHKSENALAKQTSNIFLPKALLVRVDRAITRRALGDIYAKRMRFVMIVAVTTFIGEMIHGFGDKIYEGIARMCEVFIL